MGRARPGDRVGFAAQTYRGFGAINGNGAALADLQAPAWFVDPVNGLDSNNGFTAGSALQTLSAVANRWGKENVILPQNGTNTTPPTTTITILNNLPFNDLPNFDFILGSNQFGSTQVIFKGSILSATPLVGPTSIFTTKSRSTNTPWSILTGAPASTLITGGSGGRNIRIFDVSLNAIMWGWKVNVGNVDAINVSEPFTQPNIGSRITNANRVILGGDDVFELQVIPTVNLGSFRVASERTGAAGNAPRVVFQDLCLGTATLPSEAFAFVGDGITDWYFYGCSIVRRIDAFTQFRNVFFENCYNNAPLPNAQATFQMSGLVMWDAGVWNNAFLISNPNGLLRFDMDFIFEESEVAVFGPVVEFGTCAVFDAIPFPGFVGAITVTKGPLLCFTLNDTTAAIWGGGSQGQNVGQYGVQVGPFSTFIYNHGINPATNFTLTGSLGDFALGSAPVQNQSYYPGVAGVNVTATQVAPLVNNTWVNLGTPQPVGFGGTAWDPFANAWILPQ